MGKVKENELCLWAVLSSLGDHEHRAWYPLYNWYFLSSSPGEMNKAAEMTGWSSEKEGGKRLDLQPPSSLSWHGRFLWA